MNNRKLVDKKLIKFFLFSLIIGLFLLVIGLCVQQKIELINNAQQVLHNQIDQNALYWQTIIIGLFQNIGISLIIGCIFTYILSTNEFIRFIKEKLIDIIITKDFLLKLNIEERKDMLRTILRPTKELTNIYSGINEYFSHHIDDSLQLFKTHFRGSYQLIAHAYVDKESSRVVVHSDISYRMFKVLGEFEKIFVGFEDEDVEELPTDIYAPDGRKHTIECNEIPQADLKNAETDNAFRNDQSLTKGSLSIIPDDFKMYDYLDINKKINEVGGDHWHLYSLRITQPCDKFSATLSCSDDLVVKKCIPFGNVDTFNIDIDKDRKKVKMFCNEWMKPGLGITILVAKNA